MTTHTGSSQFQLPHWSINLKSFLSKAQREEIVAHSSPETDTFRRHEVMHYLLTYLVTGLGKLAAPRLKLDEIIPTAFSLHEKVMTYEQLTPQEKAEGKGEKVHHEKWNPPHSLAHVSGLKAAQNLSNVDKKDVAGKAAALRDRCIVETVAMSVRPGSSPVCIEAMYLALTQAAFHEAERLGIDPKAARQRAEDELRAHIMGLLTASHADAIAA